MGAWAVERTGLENQQGFLPFVGSNPTPSAINMNKLLNKKIIVDNYSIESASLYENNINKNFLYGQETKKFINNLTIKNKDKVIADIGCGTGYVFELINKKYKNNNIKFYGIDPAEGMLNIAKKKINDKKTLFKKGYFEKITLMVKEKIIF